MGHFIIQLYIHMNLTKFTLGLFTIKQNIHELDSQTGMKMLL